MGIRDIWTRFCNWLLDLLSDSSTAHSPSDELEDWEKSNDQIRAEITERDRLNKPTGKLRAVLHSKQHSRWLRNMEVNKGKGTPDLEEEKVVRKFQGRPVGRLNYELNDRKSPTQIEREIAERRSQGKPTGQLEAAYQSKTGRRYS